MQYHLRRLYSSPVATAEFSKFAGILSVALSQHHLSGFEIAQLEFHHKDRNCMDLTEAEENKKRWQEYTEELHKKDLHDHDNPDGVITHLEPDILECEVK